MLSRLIAPICYGWQDCFDSLGDWWNLLGCPPLSDQSTLKVFFNMLGCPLDGAWEYKTPWNEFLDEQWYREAVQVVTWEKP